MVLGIGLGFLMQLIVARLLGSDGFGDYIYVLTWMTGLTVVGTLGFDVASIKFVSTYKSNIDWATLKGFLRISRSIVFICAGTVGFLFMVALNPISNFFQISGELKETFSIAIPLLVILSLIQTHAGVLRGFGNVRNALIPQTIVYPLFLLTSILVIHYSGTAVLGSSIVMLVNVSSALLILFLQVFLIEKSKPKELTHTKTNTRIKEWVSVSLPMALTSGSLALFRIVDILIVGAFLGTKLAGIYAIASRIAKLTSFGLQAVNMVVAPTFASLSNKGDNKNLQHIATKSAWLTFLATAPIILLLYIFADSILNMFGEDFVIGLTVLNILLVGEFINTLSGSNGILMNMSNMQREQSKIYYQSLMFLIMITSLCTYFWGIIGAAVAVAVVVSARNILTLFKLWKLARLNTTVFPYHIWFS